MAAADDGTRMIGVDTPPPFIDRGTKALGEATWESFEKTVFPKGGKTRAETGILYTVIPKEKTRDLENLRTALIAKRIAFEERTGIRGTTLAVADSKGSLDKLNAARTDYARYRAALENYSRHVLGEQVYKIEPREGVGIREAEIIPREGQKPDIAKALDVLGLRPVTDSHGKILVRGEDAIKAVQDIQKDFKTPTRSAELKDQDLTRILHPHRPAGGGRSHQKGGSFTPRAA